MIFTWTLVTLASIIAIGACIIHWDDIKTWAMNVFEECGPSLKKAYANIYRKGKKLYEKIFGINKEGKIITIDGGQPQEITIEDLYKAFEGGELSKQQFETLLNEKSVEVATLSR